jgi:hypothetical protein
MIVSGVNSEGGYSAVGSIKFRRLCGAMCHKVKTEATTIKDQTGRNSVMKSEHVMSFHSKQIEFGILEDVARRFAD